MTEASHHITLWQLGPWLREQLSRRRVRVSRVWMEADGSVLLRLPRDNGQHADFRWGPLRHAGMEPAALLGGWVGLQPAAPGDVERVSIALQRLMAELAPALLLWPNGPLAIRALDAADEPLSRFFEPGQTTWGPFTFLRCDHLPGAVLRWIFRLAPPAREPQQPPDAERQVIVQAAPARLRRDVLGSPYFLKSELELKVIRDDRDADLRHRYEGQVERLVGFALGRSLPAEVPIYIENADADLCGEARRGSPEHFTSILPMEGSMSAFETMLSSFRATGRVAIYIDGYRPCLQVPFLSWAPCFEQLSHRFFLSGLHDTHRRFYFLDGREIDLVLGREDDFLAFLTQARERDQADVVVVLDTCISRLVGRDLGGCIRSFGSEFQLPAVVQHGFRYKDSKPLSQFWSQLFALMDPQQGPSPASPPTVNLVGLGDMAFRTTRELGELLASVQIGINAHLLPGYSVNEIKTFGRADLTVINHCQTVLKEMGPVLQRQAGRPQLLIAPPFGLAGTARWLQRIGQALSLDVAPLVDQELGAVTKAWQAWREKARNHRIGVVFAHDDAAMLFQPERTYGVPVLAVLAEMGFSLHLLPVQPVLLAADSRQDEVALEQRVRQTCPELAQPGALEVTRLTAPMLQTFLREADLSLVLAPLADDVFVTGLGKQPFTLRALEMGFAGALRTIERLVQLAQSPFYSRFGRYLTPPPEALR